MNTSLQTSNLGEIDDVLNALGHPAVPLELAGQASFQGTISGDLRNPEIAGHLQASQFSYFYTPAPSPNTTPQAQPIHVDSFSGDVSYSPSNVALNHAVVYTAAMSLNIDGSAALENGDFVDNSAFQLHAVVQNGDVVSIQKTLGTDYPVTGEAKVMLQASGTKANPHGRGSVTLTKATAFGRPINSFSGDVSLQNQDLQLTNAELKAPGGVVLGSGAYNLSSHQMLADLHSEDIKLAQVPEVQLERLNASGIVHFKLHASGTPQNPAVDAHLQIDKLVLNQEHVGALTLDAVTHGQEMVITGRSNFEHAVLTIDGNVGMHGDLPGTLDVRFRDLDIDPFLAQEIKEQITGHSAVQAQCIWQDRFAGLTN